MAVFAVFSMGCCLALIGCTLFCQFWQTFVAIRVEKWNLSSGILKGIDLKLYGGSKETTLWETWGFAESIRRRNSVGALDSWFDQVYG